MIERLDARAIARLSGPSWVAIRPLVEKVHGALIGVSPTARGDLTTIYVKYTSAQTGPQPFAVLWIKTAAEIVLGIALPEEMHPPPESLPFNRPSYKGLTTFLRFSAGDEMPPDLPEWANAAHWNLSPK